MIGAAAAAAAAAWNQYATVALPFDRLTWRADAGRVDAGAVRTPGGEERVFVGRVIAGQTSGVFFARLAVFRLLSRSLCERMYFTETCVTYCLLLSMFFTQPCSVHCIFLLRLCTVVSSDV